MNQIPNMLGQHNVPLSDFARRVQERIQQAGGESQLYGGPMYSQSPLYNQQNYMIDNTIQCGSVLQIQPQSSEDSIIDKQALRTQEIYELIQAHSDDHDLNRYYWVSVRHLIHLYTTGSYDNGMWFNDNVYTYRDKFNQVIVTTNVAQLTFSQYNTVLLSTKNDNNDVNKETIVKGLIPILEYIRSICAKEELMDTSGKSTQEEEEPSASSLEAINDFIDVFRNEIKDNTQDEVAYSWFDAPIQNIYHAVNKSISKSVTLSTKGDDGFAVTIMTCAKPNGIVITFGDTVVRTTGLYNRIVDGIDVKLIDNMEYAKNIGAILNALSDWMVNKHDIKPYSVK